jgi:predicted TIM-barrel fold metal-dependent hydrolase
MDRDGVAAELIFHGSQNGQPMPFGAFTDVGAAQSPAAPRELAAVGLEIYDRWLAAFVAEAPHRHVGVAHVPMWDVDAAVAAVRAAHRDGLRAVNFPAPRPELTPYNDRSWEPFWAVCEELGMPLCTHAGSGGEAARYRGPEAEALQALEHGGWFARRAMHWMVLGGVFERHPGLLLFLVEQPGTWWTAAMAELDSVYRMQEDVLRPTLPSLPSAYCRRNVRIGGSFLAAFEADRAVTEGYADLLMWGSDYPHMEGTFQHEPEPSGESIGRKALRHTFAKVPEAAARAIVGGNAVRDLGLDAAALERIAAEIRAPTAAELAVPLAAVPAGAGLLAFRTLGPWA